MRTALGCAWLVALLAAGSSPAQAPVMEVPGPVLPGGVPVAIGGGVDGFVPGPNLGPPPPPADGGGGCGPGGCGGGALGYGLETWAEADFLLWWVRSSTLPPLATTSPVGTTPSIVGVLGTPGARTLFGDTGTNGEVRPGLRLLVGAWCDPNRVLGMEMGGFILDSRSKSATFPPGDQNLARPFIDPAAVERNLVNRTNEPTAFVHLVNLPGSGISGGMAITSKSSYIGGATWTLRHRTLDWAGGWLDILAGYRFMWLQETLDIRERGTGISPGFPATSTAYIQDLFRTRNAFHGGELGLRGQQQMGALTLEWWTKLAVGHNYQRVELAGSTQATPAGGGATVTSPGGIQVTPLNAGVYKHREAAVLPELGLNLCYNVTPNVRLRAGYTLIYWEDVFRPGKVYQGAANFTQNNPTVLGTPPNTTLVDRTFREWESLWIQGFNLGCEVRY